METYMNTQLPELLFRTFNDPLPESPADAAYLFGQTACNQASSFSAARKLYTKFMQNID